MVVILDFRLGQRSLFNRRPHHRLRSLIQRAVHHELHELARNNRFGVIIHSQIGIVPLASDTQALEFIALNINPAFSEFAAFLAQLNHRHVIFVFALSAVLFFDLPFNRQPMAIPTRNITAVLAHHLL